MFGGEDINYSLISAVREGNLERTRELINSYGLSYSPEWSHGYVLLRDAVENKHAEVTKLLLTSSSRVNSNSTEPSDTPLHFAARNGDIEIVKMLLDKGANISAKNQRGRTSLHEAIKNKAMDVTELLLSHGADVNASDVEGLTPLHFAAETGCLQIVGHLLNYGTSVNCVCTSKWYKGYAPLHFAVGMCREEVVTLLLDRGAHADVKGEDGVTPLHIAVKKRSMTFAAERGRKAIVKLLLQHGAKVDNSVKNSKTVLHLAVVTGYLTIVEDILKYCPDINDQSNRSALKIAFHGYRQNDKKIVEALLEYGFSVSPEDANNPELLHDATAKGCLKVIEDLLKYGADVNGLDDSFTPLHTAAKHKQEEVAKLLISYGADINAQDRTGKTPIFHAIENADLKISNLLLNNRANIKDIRELLNIAAQKGNEEITITLMNKGANVNDEQNDGTTPLRFAAQEGHKEVVKVLLEYGAKVDSKTKDDVTPLHLAAGKGYQEIVEIILKFGADINSRDKDDKTALYFASEGKHVEAVSTLLEYGADINITSRGNCTPLDLAKNGIRFPRNVCGRRLRRYNCPDPGFSPCVRIVEILKCHIVKLKTANLYIGEKNLKSVTSNYEMRDFQNKCEEEIASMKSEKVNNLNISFYDILAKGTSSLAVYMRNENIVQVLKSDDYKTEFPIYASMIKAHFKKVMERIELLEQANKIFHSLFNTFPGLPYDCTEQIFSYLNEENLKNFNRCLQAS